MGPLNLRELESGDTLMLAREILNRDATSQIYVKVDDTTVHHFETEDSVTLPAEELVYPFEPIHAATP
jgi:hypothetical protein